MKKRILAALAACIFISGLVACGTPPDSTTKDNVPAKTEAEKSKKTNIVFWHSMGGNNGETIDMLAKQFNDSQSDITIEPQYQGTYEESINKLKTAMRTKSGPDIVQIYEGGTRFMADSNFITPMQDLVDKYKIDISDLEPNILAYYKVNGKLNSMPFNTSAPLLYYNKTLLTKLGYPNGPADWKELKEIALKVVAEKDPATPYGFVLMSDPWFFEQPLVQTGVNIVDNNNGRTAAPTKCVLGESDRPQKIVEAWLDLKTSGALADLGFTSNDITAAFTSGMGAMTMASTGGLRNFLDTIGGKFELGTAFFPPLDKNEPNGGVTLGGASIYVCDNGKGEDMEEAIAKFLSFMISPDTQAFWHIRSGYFPVTTAAYNVSSVKENLAKYPQFQTAIDQLHSSKNMGSGAIYGSFVEGRDVYKKNIEQVLMGKITPKECISNSVKDIDALIGNYNKANK